MSREIIKTVTIRPGKRIIIEPDNYGFRIRTQEHKSIIGQYARTDSDGWRDCVVSYERNYPLACAEMNRRLRSYGISCDLEEVSV